MSKCSYLLDASMVDEMRAAATYHDASLSWVVQQAWQIAREEIAKLPSCPSWEARQRALAQKTPSPPSKSRSPAEIRRTAPTPQPPPPSVPPEVPLSDWEMKRLAAIQSERPLDLLDHQAREMYPWHTDWPTI